MKKIADDVFVQIIEQDGLHVLSIVIQDGIRENKSINFVGDEIESLFDYLKSELGEE